MKTPQKIWVPGSKSLTNRALLLAALSDKEVTLSGVLDSDDSRYMKGALETFGAEITIEKPGQWRVVPPDDWQGYGQEIFIGNAGTAARFLSALSLLVEGDYTLAGVPRMKERPQEDLLEALAALGLKNKALEKPGFLPVCFQGGGGETGKKVTISGRVSSQFLSGLMLVAPRLKDGLEIEVSDGIPSLPYIQMTVKILHHWGVQIEVDEGWKNLKILPGMIAPDHYAIPADMSSASYPLLWSVLKQRPIEIQNFGVETWQGDERFLDVIEKVGAKLERRQEKLLVSPPAELTPLGDWDWSAMPDVSMTGMVLAAFTPGTTKFTGLESLRVKECDRIAAMEQLRAFGVEISVEGDDMKITGGSISLPAGVEIDPFDDHRIAMCFGVLKTALGLGSDPLQQSPINITEPECVGKTWPDFWLDLATWEGELRGVAGIIVRKNSAAGTHYLLVRKPRKIYAWQFPQGGIDEGETLKQAASRELAEECGTDLSVKLKGERGVGSYRYFFPVDSYRHDKRFLGAQVDFLAADWVRGEPVVDNEEIVEARWVDMGELESLVEEDYWEVAKCFLPSS